MSVSALPASAQVLRGLFLLLLATTGIAKLFDMPGFYGIVAAYRLLPEALVPASAWALALVEITLAGWLAWGRALRPAALLIVLLHLMYLGWLLIALVRGLALANCGCFGVYLARPLSWTMPFEDTALLALALALWAQVRRADA